jgi:hypothetical protein
MRYVLGAFAAVALSAIIAAPGAQAQPLPQGSYLQSCRDVRIEGGALSGMCRTMNGAWMRTALGDVRLCSGDIGNINGQLTCNRQGGLPAYGGERFEHRELRREGLREEPMRLRCEGIVDPLQRARCFERR